MLATARPAKPKTDPDIQKRAAAYVRVSTDHQRYSIDNQLAAINDYASRNGLAIVEVFADRGRSGLTYEKRDALKRLIETVQLGTPNFGVVLVLDVSRWGRFQDVDESAYYEYSCRRGGIRVHYVAEPFDGNAPLAAILKAIKRTMAAEYSRELSAKVIAGKHRLARMGFRQGGTAGYGLRRAVIDEDRNITRVLHERSERKSRLEERIILVPGPVQEIRWVRRIYRYYVEDGLTKSEIVRRLNARGLRTDRGSRWTWQTVDEVLTNEKYIGHSVQIKSSYRLKTKHKAHPPDLWIRADHAFAPIVPEALFMRAQEEARRRRFVPSDAEMLSWLKELLRKKGYLSARLLDGIGGRRSNLRSATTYRKRFGGMQQIYARIGYHPSHLRTANRLRAHLGRIAWSLEKDLIRGAEAIGMAAGRLPSQCHLIKVGANMIVALVVCARASYHRDKRWAARVSRTTRQRASLIAAIRMDETNAAPAEYYLIPARLIVTERIRFWGRDKRRFAEFRMASRSDLLQAIYKAAIT